MSVAFAQQQKGRHNPSPAQIQKMLDENSQLIQAIVDYQNKGKASECLQYQQILHRNLVYLASVADAGPVVQASLSSQEERWPPGYKKSDTKHPVPPPQPCGPGSGGAPSDGSPNPASGMMPGQQGYGGGMPQPGQQSAAGNPRLFPPASAFVP